VGGVTVVLKIFFNMRNVRLSIRSGSQNVDDVFYMESGDENQYRALCLLSPGAVVAALHKNLFSRAL
jgi:hypothetical protein